MTFPDKSFDTTDDFDDVQADNPPFEAPGLLSEYFSETDLAQQLSLCRQTIVRWRALGEGPPATMLGRRVMFRRSTVEAWLRSREIDPEIE